MEVEAAGGAAGGRRVGGDHPPLSLQKANCLTPFVPASLSPLFSVRSRPVRLSVCLCLCMSLSVSLSDDQLNGSKSSSEWLQVQSIPDKQNKQRSDGQRETICCTPLLHMARHQEAGPNLKTASLSKKYSRYRGTSLIRNTPLLGPYRRPMPRVLWGS